MPVFNIHHITKYEYDRPVKESVNDIRIFPFACPEQETLFHELHITGQPDVHIINDYWGNRTGIFNLMGSHKELIVESKLIIRTLGSFANQSAAGFDTLKEEINSSLALMELCHTDTTQIKQEIKGIISEIYTPEKTVQAVVADCCNYIYKEFKYIKGITNIETTVEEILQHRSGVCQDFAHVMLEILRTLHIPCRYVSGYICPNKNGMRGEGATHAWVEAWIPAAGWMGIDPTNNVWTSSHHVKLAVGRNFNDCSPVKGTFKGPARQSLSVFVSVGYEDGHTFEDVTRVKLESQAGIPEEPEVIETFAGQQQQ